MASLQRSVVVIEGDPAGARAHAAHRAAGDQHSPPPSQVVCERFGHRREVGDPGGGRVQCGEAAGVGL